MHIVIGGDDEVAFRMAENLMQEHGVVLVLPEEHKSTLTDSLDCHSVQGRLTSSATLRKAGVENADVYIACSEQDERNLVSCVAARRLGARRTVCFLFNRDFRSSADDDLAVADSLGIDEVVRPAQQLADEIVRIVTVPGALEVQAFAGGKVRLLQRAVKEGSRLTTGPLRDLDLPENVVFVMARRAGEMVIPTGKTHFAAGDRVTCMGSSRGLHAFMTEFADNPEHDRESRTATIVGGGAVGLGVAQGLSKAGWTIRIIEFDRRRAEEIAPLVKAMVIHGDGSDLGLMEQEQVAEDSVLVAVTSNDEKNLLVSLLARHMGIPRIVTRADTLDHERLFEKVGIDVIRSVRGAALRSVLRSMVREREEILVELEHGDAEVLSLEIPEGVVTPPLGEIHQPVQAIVGAILRKDEVIFPVGTTVMRGGDRILVFCARADEAETRTFFTETLLEAQDAG